MLRRFRSVSAFSGESSHIEVARPYTRLFFGRRKQKRSSNGRRPLGNFHEETGNCRNEELSVRRIQIDWERTQDIFHHFGARGPTVRYGVFGNARVCDWDCLSILWLFVFSCRSVPLRLFGPSSEAGEACTLWVWSVTCSVGRPPAGSLCDPFPSLLPRTSTLRR